MKKVLALTNKYIIIATPLLLFLFFLSIYFISVMQNAQLLKLLFSMILVFLMFSAFVSGWGNMIKFAVLEKNNEEPYLIIKDFIPGVGEYFLPAAAILFLAFLFNLVLLIFVFYVGLNLIGDIGISSSDLSGALINNEALKAFLTSLSVEQLVKLNLWNLLILGAMTIFYFLTMFFIPALFFESKNPLKAILNSFKHLFSKRILLNIGIYFLIVVLNFVISVFSALCAGNSILSFIMTLINFYFICCVVIGIFYYYNKNFVNSHLGNSIDTYI